MSNQELFERIAAIFNLPVEVDNNGDMTLEIEDTVFMHNAYKDLIKPQIENKMALIKACEMDIAPMKGKERLIAIDELFKYRRELFDLDMEYLKHNDYIKNYQGHIERSRISYEQALTEAKNELPKLIKEVKTYLNNIPDFFAVPINAQLYGLIMRCNAALDTNNEKDIPKSYNDLKIIYHYATTETKSDTK